VKKVWEPHEMLSSFVVATKTESKTNETDVILPKSQGKTLFSIELG
jgi:hypothetical protein